jgi:uncharacterized protein DUF6585
MAANNPSYASTLYGAPIGAYRGGATTPVILGILGASALLFGIYLLNAIPPSADPSGMVFTGITFITIALIFLGVMMWKILKARSASALLFEQGFVISVGGKTTTARWEDITSVTQKIVRTSYNGIPVGTSYRFTIALANGETVRIDNTFGKPGQLGDAIQRLSANALLPRALAAYQSGASLPFGKISISRAGISDGAETPPWSFIKPFTLRNGALIIKRTDKRRSWVTMPIAKTPNIYVLMTLVERIQRGAI